MENEKSNVLSRPVDTSGGRTGNIVGAIVRAGLNSAPFAGGVASLWSEWDTHRRFGRIEQCLAEMSKILERASMGKVGLKLEDAELQLIDEVIERVQREHREDKRQMFAHLLASTLIRTEVSFDKRMRFVRALDEFEDVHIATMRVLRDRHLAGEGPVRFTNLGTTVLGSKIGDEETEAIFIPVLNALVAAYGFVFRRTPAVKGAAGAGSTSPEAIAKQCEHVIRPLGLLFLEFLEEPTKTEAPK